jgi:hypothetical protein
MKLTQKVTVHDKKNNIVAIIDTDGKILTDNKDVKALLNYLMTAELTPTPYESGDKFGIKYIAPKNDATLQNQLGEELPKYGYKL